MWVNKIKKVLSLIFVVSFLTSCSPKQSQYFIFKRYDDLNKTWKYYKTDIYNPSRVEGINNIPCGEDKRLFPDWSPNGQYYVCSAAYDLPLIVYNTDGVVMTSLEQGQGRPRWISAGWSPDSQSLIIWNIGTSATPYFDISIMKYDGSNFHQIVKESKTTLRNISWAPNGEYIVYESSQYNGEHDYIIVVDTKGEELSRVDLAKLTVGRLNFLEEVQWSPDSRKLAFRKFYNDNGTVSEKLFVLNTESGKYWQVTPDSLCAGWFRGWSPNSEEMLFVAYECSKHVSGTYYDDAVPYLVKQDGSDLQVLTEDKDFFRWTPDGSSVIVYGNNGTLYLKNFDGTNKKKLINDGDFVSWIKP